MAADPIVVGTDGSPRAEVAVDRAAEVAQALGAPLHIVCAPEALPGHDSSALATAQQVVVQSAERLQNQGISVQTHVPEGEAAPALVALADQEHAQMLVVGNKGMVGIHRAMGSLPNRVTHQARCGVLIVRTKSRSPSQFGSGSVVVATNGTSEAMRAVKEAIRLSKALGSELHVVSIFKPPSSPEEAVAAATEEAARQGVAAIGHVTTDEPVWAIHRVSKQNNAAIIVVSDAGMHPDERVRLGNIPDTLSHRGTASLLIVSAGDAGQGNSTG